MVSFRNLFASALAISSSVALGASLPVTENSLAKRGRADIVKEILKAIGVFTNDNVYTWVSSMPYNLPHDCCTFTSDTA